MDFKSNFGHKLQFRHKIPKLYTSGQAEIWGVLFIPLSEICNWSEKLAFSWLKNGTPLDLNSPLIGQIYNKCCSLFMITTRKIENFYENRRLLKEGLEISHKYENHPSKTRHFHRNFWMERGLFIK